MKNTNHKHVAILGGTFDPIHNGHIQIAKLISSQYHFDKVLFIPNNIPPHREQPIATTQQRLAMLKLAINSDLSSSNFEINTCELDRLGNSYMVETLNYLQSLAEYHTVTFWLLLGLDAFYQLPSWHLANELMTKCNFIVINRLLPDVKLESPPAWAQKYLDNNLITSDELQDKKLKPSGAVLLLNNKAIDISASYIRRLLKSKQEHNKALQNILPKPVLSYLTQNNIYS